MPFVGCTLLLQGTLRITLSWLSITVYGFALLKCNLRSNKSQSDVCQFCAMDTWQEVIRGMDRLVEAPNPGHFKSNPQCCLEVWNQMTHMKIFYMITCSD